MTLHHVPQVGDTILYRCCGDLQQAGTVTSNNYGRPGLVQVSTMHRYRNGDREPVAAFAFVDVTDPRRAVEYAGPEVTRTGRDGEKWLLVTSNDEQPVHAGRELRDDEGDRFRVLGEPVPAEHPLAQMSDTVMIQWITMGGEPVTRDPQPWNPYSLGMDWIEQPQR